MTPLMQEADGAVGADTRSQLRRVGCPDRMGSDALGSLRGDPHRRRPPFGPLNDSKGTAANRRCQIDAETPTTYA